METMELLTVIIIAASVLQIILFFKVWMMTDDVKKLREKFTSPGGSNFNFEIRKLLMSGENENAKELLINRFYVNIAGLNYSGIDSSDFNYEQIKKNTDADFTKIKEALEKDLKQIGYELPENIRQMKSGNEFYCLFRNSR